MQVIAEVTPGWEISTGVVPATRCPNIPAWYGRLFVDRGEQELTAGRNVGWGRAEKYRSAVDSYHHFRPVKLSGVSGPSSQPVKHAAAFSGDYSHNDKEKPKWFQPNMKYQKPNCSMSDPGNGPWDFYFGMYQSSLLSAKAQDSHLKHVYLTARCYWDAKNVLFNESRRLHRY